jgi:F-box/leucine-rich repeat protein 2/20
VSTYTSLTLRRADFLYDHHIVELSIFLAHLVYINLTECWQLTDSTLFALVRNCPSLRIIRMEHTSIGENIRESSDSLTDFVVNLQLKSLYLAHNSWLRNESLIMFASIFLNLQLLDLSYCYNISEESIYQVLKRCCKIKHLNLTKCNLVKLNILNFQVPKLEVLNLSDTSVDDETLYVISKNCCGLLQLLLESCNNVTNMGVKHVVENCTQLREINLRNCYKVSADIVNNMVHSRTSLRKILFK